MTFQDKYVKKLEETITKMLPVYDKYYELTKLPKPELDVLILSLSRSRDKTPVLLKKE